MGTIDQRVDDYIDKAEAFAVPILLHLRQLIHSTCPEVVETIKWRFPNFEYRGALLCNMASFKKHCAFGFWKAAMMKDPKGLFAEKPNEAMGHLGQLRSIADLPADKILVAYLKEAMKLNEEGLKPARRIAKVAKALEMPEAFRKALGNNKAAQKVFEGFNQSSKNDYIEWIAEAKTEATRLKRIDTALEWIAEGKTRHWKYK